MSDEIENLDAAPAAAYGKDRTVADMAKPKVRRAKEKRHALRPDDGRRKRATGRTAQFNTKMKPDLRDRVAQASRMTGKAIAVLVEEALEAYLQKVPHA